MGPINNTNHLAARTHAFIGPPGEGFVLDSNGVVATNKMQVKKPQNDIIGDQRAHGKFDFSSTTKQPTICIQQTMTSLQDVQF